MFCILSNIQDYSQFVVFVVVADVCDHDLESVTTKFLVFSSVTMSNFVHDVFSLPACWNLLAANVAWWPVQHVHLVNNCALLVLVKACCKYIGGFGIFLKSGYMARMTTHMGSWSCHHLCSICREFFLRVPWCRWSWHEFLPRYLCKKSQLCCHCTVKDVWCIYP